jgi:hypothetical protein
LMVLRQPVALNMKLETLVLTSDALKSNFFCFGAEHVEQAEDSPLRFVDIPSFVCYTAGI